MKLVKLQEGDDCWIYFGKHRGKLTKAKVLSVIRIAGYSFDHYVVGIPTHVETILEIRDGFTVSDAENQPIGMWRKS